jgi:hypothetical protein
MAFDNRHATALGFLVIGGAIAGGAALLSGPTGPTGPDDLPPPTPYVAPSFSFAPYTGPVTLCRDGWVSHSTGRGTCSHHGGEA